MEPKWNVKRNPRKLGRMGMSINGTKVECKALSLQGDIQIIIVLMEPKWNVKLDRSVLIEYVDMVLMEPKWNVKGMLTANLDIITMY